MYRKEGGGQVSLIEMLPFLEGFEYLYFSKEETVEKGKHTTIFSRDVKGWIYSLDFASDDAYASFVPTYMGKTDVRTPNYFFVAGATLPPPSGSYVLNYLRPSTLSTAGIYAVSLITSAYPIPIKGLVRLEVGLESESTQTTATVSCHFFAFEITDEKAFIRSYRRFKYGWLGWAFEVLSRIPGLKYIGIPEEIKEVVE